MRIPRIYQNTPLELEQRIALDKPSSHHLIRVLRIKDNDSVILFNGQGGEYRCSVNIDGKKAFVHTKEFSVIERESNLDITLLQGISKGERMDFSIQKAVELGVNRIIPIHCQRTVVNLNTERQAKKHQHWQGIIINACEQSGRNQLPQLDSILKFTDIFSADIDGLKLTLDPLAENQIKSLTPTSNKICLLIGPEGGLSPEEIEQANNDQFIGIQLGARILRTETAALAAIAALQTQWGDFN